MVTTFEDIMEQPERLIECIYDKFGVQCDDLSENVEWLHIDSQAETIFHIITTKRSFPGRHRPLTRSFEEVPRSRQIGCERVHIACNGDCTTYVR